MKLYLLRHGDAVAHGDPRYLEHDRPLTPAGIEQTQELGAALRRIKTRFDAAFSSPLVRAKQTAEIILRALGTPELLTCTEHLAPAGRLNDLVQQLGHLHPAPDSVLLVGHEPYLSQLASLLCLGGSGLPLELKKGGLCRLAIERLAAGKCASLQWLLPPELTGGTGGVTPG